MAKTIPKITSQWPPVIFSLSINISIRHCNHNSNTVDHNIVKFALNMSLEVDFLDICPMGPDMCMGERRYITPLDTRVIDSGSLRSHILEIYSDCLWFRGPGYQSYRF